MRSATVLMLAVLFAGSARAGSAAFDFSGVCGQRNYTAENWETIVWAIAPWLSKPITIIGAGVSMRVDNEVYQPMFLSAVLGNSYDLDPLTDTKYAWAPASDRWLILETHHDYPAGTGSKFPASEGITDPTKTYHLDLHLYDCSPAGNPYAGTVTIWWQSDGAQIQPRNSRPGFGREIQDSMFLLHRGYL